ncbi:MAG: AAA family ATPase [Acuticoccus sp.]
MPETADEADARAAQEPVIGYLAGAACHDGTVPEHVETHLSHLFLAGDRVLKLKKALRWAMVDYLTPAQREHFCRHEVAVNRAFAPEIYRGVLPVTREGGELALGGAGEAVDFVVEMRRFAADEQLDVMVDAGTITPEIIDATADVTAAMHRAARKVRRTDGAAAVAARVAQLARDVGASPAAPAADVAAFGSGADALVSRYGAALDRRARHGFVKRCHGDLHLSNVCLWQGRPTPFDAIEFSEEIATIDVLYDVAFLLVDLELRGRADLSTRLLSRYLGATRDYRGLALMRLFKAQRAMVRALTRAAKGADPGPEAAMARALVAPPPAARLIAVGGLSGSGKTTVARAIAPALDAVVIRSDTVRKHLAGVAPEERLDPSFYQPGYTGRVYRRMMVDARRALGAGATVILDATFTEPAMAAAAAALAADAGTAFHGLWLSAPAETLSARVAGRGRDASDADAAVVARQVARAGAAPAHWQAVDATGGPQAVARRALDRLGATP